MPTRTIRLYSIFIPLLTLGLLQLSSCSSKKELPPPPPGGTYLSANGAGSFSQSPNIKDETGETISYNSSFSLHTIHRSLNNPDQVYTLSNSGVFVSNDNGETWQGITQPLSRVMGIAKLDNEVILLAGADSKGNGVIIRSLDDAKTWEEVLTIPAPIPAKGRLFEIVKPPPPPPVFVGLLVVDPFDHNQVLASTSTGEVMLGSQSGKLWRTALRTNTNNKDPISGRITTPIKAIIPSPHRQNEFLLLTTTNEIHLFSDGVETTLPLPVSSTLMDAGYVNQFPDAFIIGTQQGVYISRDRAKTWVPLEVPISRAAPVNAMVVTVSPTNASRIFVTANSVIYRSEDGGKNWISQPLGLPNHLITDFDVNPANASSVLLTTSFIAT